MEIKNSLSKIKPDVRRLNDMKDVLYDQNWVKNAPDLNLYYMYRGVEKKGGLRYDVTNIVPVMLGEEFPKTKGHEHSKNFQEVYTVLKGKALYLVQKCRDGQVLDVFAVRAKKGESVLIPPGYGHITINSSGKILEESNWISEKCENIYDLFKKMNGACYYYTKSGWIRNKNYKKIPKLRFEKPLKKLPQNLDFLLR